MVLDQILSQNDHFDCSPFVIFTVLKRFRPREPRKNGEGSGEREREEENMKSQGLVICVVGDSHKRRQFLVEVVRVRVPSFAPNDQTVPGCVSHF